MIKVRFTSRFVRQVKALPKELFEEALEKINLFKDKRNHKTLKTHKLHGELAGLFSFSVNYKTRIVFEFSGKNEAWFYYFTI